MNQYLKNLSRIEFVVTLACTGSCKHCSQGEHSGHGGSIDRDAAVRAVREIANNYQIRSVMTFGGEPLLCPDTVCAIHSEAREAGVPKRQLITNGFFSRNFDTIWAVAEKLAGCGVNDILLSVDAFHQETIPLGVVKAFAGVVKKKGVPIRVQPAWLVSREADNPYNERTREIIAEFEPMGIEANGGNVILPEGNALRYLGAYFAPGQETPNPYRQDPWDVRTLSIAPNGDVLNGNICRQEIRDILAAYRPEDR